MLTRRHLFVLTALSLLILGTGCSQRTPTDLEAARALDDPLVFDEAIEGVYFQPFSGTDPYVVALDSTFAHSGDWSLKVSVPPAGSALGGYAGGVLTSIAKRDLVDYDALTFWARSSVDVTLNTVGFGNDNTGTSLYEAGRENTPLTTDWTYVVVPIPAAEKLFAERGMFTIAEGFEAQHPDGHDIWFDDIRFAEIDGIDDTNPVLSPTLKHYFVGALGQPGNAYTRYNIDGQFITVDHSPNYFQLVSQDPAVAVIEGHGIRIVGTGEVRVTATLGLQDAQGYVYIYAHDPPAGTAPAPTLPAGDVISVFSDVYDDIPVDNWNPDWGQSTEVSDFVLEGDNTKMYSTLNWAGIDFASRTVDVTGMTHLHLDVFAPQGEIFNVEIVAFDGDNGNNLEQVQLVFDADSTPAFTAGAWTSLDIPIADFGMTVPLDHVGQIVLSTPLGLTGTPLVLVDNIYWHR